MGVIFSAASVWFLVSVRLVGFKLGDRKHFSCCCFGSGEEELTLWIWTHTSKIQNDACILFPRARFIRLIDTGNARVSADPLLSPGLGGTGSSP